MPGMKTRAIKAQPCQYLNVPAGINNSAATMIRPTEKRRTNFDLRLISICHSYVGCALRTPVIVTLPLDLSRVSPAHPNCSNAAEKS